MPNVTILCQGRRKRVYRRVYDEPVEQAVLAIWDFFHRLCGKRLIPLIRANRDTLAAEFNLSRGGTGKTGAGQPLHR
jgi:hypothetical protein